MSKSKAKKPNVKGAADDDDDWEAILAEEAKANGAAQVKEQVPDVAAAQPVPPQVDDKDGGDDESDDDENEDESAGVAKKDKKKKKKKGKKEEKKAAVPSTTSAAGKAILLRQQQLAEEEARLKKLQEEEERRIKEEEEREEAERRAIEEEKERKRKAKQDKVDAQKAAGTYMTKAEKEKAKKAQAKLDAMRAAGLLPGAVAATQGSQSASAPEETVKTTSQSSIYAKKKKPASGGASSSHKSNNVDDANNDSLHDEKSSAAAQTTEDVADDWDAVDDWESNVDVIAAKVEQIAVKVLDEEVEDRLEVDNRVEQEKLRALGVERARREEEARIKREEEEREREEMERQAREAAMRKENSRKRRTERDQQARNARSADNLRSPISCIMGHVDTGKTKLLDKIRHTNVQEGEAGGITQQIGATQFSKETLALQTAAMQKTRPFEIKIPGLLVIDTPGHESFTNLRNRGSSLCDIAILVIDLMHGLEQQTIESLNMLRRKKTPFVVALNKVDRCYGWKTMPDCPIQEALAVQDENCRLEFKDRAERVILQLNEQGLNAKLYWENDDPDDTISLVPTSAISGEGVPDLLAMLITNAQERQTEQLMYMEVLQCTVLEVKVIEGLGHTVDVVLVNGTLREGDTIVVSTMEGPVVTNIRALLTPPPNREMRVKNEYVHHEVLQGAIGIKIVAPDIARAIAGTPLLVIQPEDDIEDVKEDVQSDLTSVMKALETDARGVMVHASTLGALEALLQFLREECKPPIPVSHINIGPIFKRDVMRANLMNEKNLPEFATILAFDVRVDAEARAFAEEVNVRIFTAEIIYHLFDQFSAFMNGLNEQRRAEAEAIAMFPVVLKILPQHIFNKKDPIVMGVDIVEGSLRLGTVLTIPSLGLDVGRVISIENNHRETNVAKKGTSVAIKISNESNPTITYGRQFDHTNTLYSKISRASIDALKQFFKDDMTKDDWNLVIKLKKVFNIT